MISFWEQRNAAVVVRVLEEKKRKEKKREKGESQEEIYSLSGLIFSVWRVLPRSRWFGLGKWQLSFKFQSNYQLSIIKVSTLSNSFSNMFNE